ncbi:MULTISPECIES: hypothetical protein [unclassified Mesorhizobium]|uniref:hypothetical protein n=1 Tax=unclassified Mesorhizobium TaxID=325217 RepID=UPI00333B3930
MTITVDFVVGVAAVAYPGKGGGFTKTLLRGRTSRVVVTMGMPSFFTGSGSSATALPAQHLRRIHARLDLSAADRRRGRWAFRALYGVIGLGTVGP